MCTKKLENEGACTTTAGGGLLTGEEILKYGLIEGLDEDETRDERLQAASYDLRVGDRHFLFEDTGNWKGIYLGNTSALKEINEEAADPSHHLSLPRQGGHALIIPSFGSAIIQLRETVNLLDGPQKDHTLIAGRFDLKLKAIYKGLISQQATQVEPCYKGKLYCFVHNLGDQEVVLERDTKIATIEFSFVGSHMDEDERNKIWEKTLENNREKFQGDKSTPFSDENGITDIRWLQSAGYLPQTCGIAPIHRLVNNNIDQAVETHLEKSDTIDTLAERVGNRLSEKQNAIKVTLSLVAAVITFFATGLLLETQQEMRYFSEELSFLAEREAAVTPESLIAIQNHTRGLEKTRCTLWTILIVAMIIIVVLLLVFFFGFMRPMYEQKWEHKKKSLEAKQHYKEYKKNKAKNKPMGQ